MKRIIDFKEYKKSMTTVDADVRFPKLEEAYSKKFGTCDALRFFSVSGRTEIIGNHTDHQHGTAIGASIDLDVVAAVSKTDTDSVVVSSKGHKQCVVSLDSLEAEDSEKGSSTALVKGVLKGMKDRGYKIGGFNAVTDSIIPSGGGMSSSAAFEVLICEIISALYNDGNAGLVDEVNVSQFAENIYFGKPCGLLDQICCAYGGYVYIDFADGKKPFVERLAFDPVSYGYVICITNVGTSHAKLTDDYAAIPSEMRMISGEFGKEYLREVCADEFFARQSEFAEKFSNRTALRAKHFFTELVRVEKARKAILENDINGYLKAVKESGASSRYDLQNVCPSSSPDESAVSRALDISADYFGDKGVCRVHGGGFAGTVQAVVPVDMADGYVSLMNSKFGDGACMKIGIRPFPACEIRFR